jgi:hypothetical protein
MDPTLHAYASKAPGFMPDDEGLALHDAALAAAGNGPLVEIGSYLGRSTLYLAAAARHGNRAAAQRLRFCRPTPFRLCRMALISTWNLDDKPPRRRDAARELVVVWAVHLRRSYRIIRGGSTA